MPRLLHICASPRSGRSRSRRLAREFIELLRAGTEIEVHELDTSSVQLPSIDEAFLEARYSALRGEPHTGSGSVAWQEALKAAGHFSSFDAYLFSLPMWNFGVPYGLKHYIDLITQPRALFDKSNGRLVGLCAGRPVCIAHASGGEYLSADRVGLQHTVPYLRTWLGFIGIDVLDVIDISGTSDSSEEANDREVVARVARRFAARLEPQPGTPTMEKERGDHA